MHSNSSPSEIIFNFTSFTSAFPAPPIILPKRSIPALFPDEDSRVRVHFPICLIMSGTACFISFCMAFCRRFCRNVMLSTDKAVSEYFDR